MTYEIIKELCRKSGTTITALEKDLGFGRGSLSKLKNGGQASGDRLKKVADYFGVSVAYLMDEQRPESYYLDPETAKIAQELYDSRDLRMLFDAARGVAPENLRLAAEMLRRFKGEDDD